MAYTLQRITIFPIKSLPGVALERAQITPAGSLRHDREYALFDADGQVVNGKRERRVHGLDAEFAPDIATVRITDRALGESARFPLPEGRAALSEWLSDYFRYRVRVLRAPQGGFPDDREANGPTLVGTATLETVTTWFPELDLAEIRRRFRTNLEIAAAPPFWEDGLLGEPGVTPTFHIGAVHFEAIRPCQRCVVPTRSSSTGQPDAQFQEILSQKRCQELPPWTPAAYFDHYYRLCLNTRILTGGQAEWLKTGDVLTRD
ncbi:MAG: MOSC N-terminal beta barrel domain-containing protein [Pseudomonadota bacterium]|nr:MOSC N-terminal beta barrel domain-containing protein [Pseudomonadota bacterium]